MQRIELPVASRPPLLRTHLSYSSISLFQSCSLRYYFRYVLGLPEETTSSSLVFGKAIHQALQHHFEMLLAGNSAPDLGTLVDVFQEAWRAHESSIILFSRGEDLCSLERLAERMLGAFQGSTLARPEGSVIGIEEEMQGQVVAGCPDLLARIDLIIETDDALIVTDFKTSRKSWSQERTREAAVQLWLYGELARKIADGMAVRLEFAVLTKERNPQVILLPISLDPHQLERTKKIVERVWAAIQMGHFYPSPSAMTCPSCPYRRPCKAWQG